MLPFGLRVVKLQTVHSDWLRSNYRADQFLAVPADGVKVRKLAAAVRASPVKEPPLGRWPG
jgi:hypothetical protein